MLRADSRSLRTPSGCARRLSSFGVPPGVAGGARSPVPRPRHPSRGVGADRAFGRRLLRADPVHRSARRRARPDRAPRLVLAETGRRPPARGVDRGARLGACARRSAGGGARALHDPGRSAPALRRASGRALQRRLRHRARLPRRRFLSLGLRAPIPDPVPAAGHRPPALPRAGRARERLGPHLRRRRGEVRALAAHASLGVRGGMAGGVSVDARGVGRTGAHDLSGGLPGRTTAGAQGLRSERLLHRDAGVGVAGGIGGRVSPDARRRPEGGAGRARPSLCARQPLGHVPGALSGGGPSAQARPVDLKAGARPARGRPGEGGGDHGRSAGAVQLCLLAWPVRRPVLPAPAAWRVRESPAGRCSPGGGRRRAGARRGRGPRRRPGRGGGRSLRRDPGFLPAIGRRHPGGVRGRNRGNNGLCLYR